jgi:Zn-finger in ubiquitin-hydrolases and other protein
MPNARSARRRNRTRRTVAPCHAVAVAAPCQHLEPLSDDVSPSSEGCEDCLPIGGRWVHLRMCMTCGHVGCCDNSPNRHATAHWHAEPDHCVVRSYEPGEDWWWCYADDLAFEIEGAPPSPSHP